MSDLDTMTRTRIISAAKERFRHYGYPKTTMAEVASDCNMSPGNLYRYFKGKLDIATEIAREESIITVERLRPLIECPVRPARERLEEIMFTRLRESFHKLENKPKAIELAQIVATQRPRFFLENLRRERRVIAIVLDYGRQTGEFRVEDIPQTAAALQAATMKYHYPQLFFLGNLRRKHRVVAIVRNNGRQTGGFKVAGIRRKAASSGPEGHQTGEFETEDGSQAEAALQAADKHHHPQLFTSQTLQELEAELSVMLNLFFLGLMNAPPALEENTV